MKDTLKILILVDTIVITALFGLVAPTFAVFVNEELIGGGKVAIGIAAFIYFLIRGIFFIPFGKLSDKYGKKPFIIVGYFLTAFIPLFYFAINRVWQLYLVQGLYGLGAAIAWPAWFAVFEYYTEKGKESYRWGIWQTMISLAMALTALISGYVAEVLGFKALYIMSGILAIVGCFFLFKIKEPPKSST